jgi:hypothetical protein
MNDAALIALRIVNKYKITGGTGIYLSADIRDAILAERERCAKIVESTTGRFLSTLELARIIRNDS